MNHFLAPTDLTHAEREAVLNRAIELKALKRPLDRTTLRVGALFFNASLRTRISFEKAAEVIGGTCLTLNTGSDTYKMEMDPEAAMNADTQENIVEAAGVLGRMFDIIGVRSFPTGQAWEIEKTEPILRAFAEHSGVPVVSLEGALHHPCQGLADHLTMKEHFGETKKLKVAMTWAPHPKPLPMAVPNSFALQSALAGCDLKIVRPEGYDLDPEVMASIESESAAAGGSVEVTSNRDLGLEGANVVYVKSWGRMDHPGQSADASLADWTFGDSAWEMTDQAKVMHCLPVRRNVVISSSILDSDRSIVLDEAENRLWAQAGLLDHISKGVQK
jgi:ornithine carbamoyltransferase